jgi:BirA family transcriptional regulator, biotin operon repressor / biotin---[acetyl-CoA-carboxylase] ligase
VSTQVAFLSRHERFRSVPSTNDIVRSWLTAGTAEVCMAVAGEQTAGRGRSGRSWVAPDGAALLLSLGFRPGYLAADRLWRLAAIVSLAMADAAEEVAGLAVGKLRLKWPNDLVVETGRGAAPGLKKIAGVLGETEGAGTTNQLAIVGIGINADWPAADFPAELADAMTSLREVSGGRPVDRDALLAAFLLRLEPRVLALRDGHFDVAGWHDRQVTTGRMVRLEESGGRAVEARAVGVDGVSGALLVEDAATPGVEREVLAGEVIHVRLAGEGDPSSAPGVTP